MVQHLGVVVPRSRIGVVVHETAEEMRLVGVHIQHALCPAVAIHDAIEVVAIAVKQDGVVVLPLSIDKIADIIFSSVAVVFRIDGHARAMRFAVFQRTVIHELARFVVCHF